MNESISTCVACADSKTASYHKMDNLRVNIDALRKEGFSIEIAPPANESDYHRLKVGGSRLGRRVNPSTTAALDALLARYTCWPPYGAVHKICTEFGVTHVTLATALRGYRRKNGIKREAVA